MKISKDLYESVTNQNFNDKDFRELSIPYDSFFFECKKWAHQKGFLLDSRTTHCGSCFLLSSPFVYSEEINKTFLDETEKQAVFNACQWILENKEKIK